LHLFAGAGGGILGGLLLGHTPVCAVELDPYCRRVLRARQDDGILPRFPIFTSVRPSDYVQKDLWDCQDRFVPQEWRGRVDVVAGGFPCQPWSQAGKHKGSHDPRHLWPEMARIVEDIRPRYVFAENVSLAAFAEPWRDLRRLGYRVPPAICVSAADVGAPHLRKRWWLLAVADEDAEADSGRCKEQRQSQPAGQQGALRDEPDGLRARLELDPASADADSGALRHAEQRKERRRLDIQDGGCSEPGHDGRSRRVAYAGGEGLAQRQGQAGQRAYASATGAGWWAIEPDVGRVADGVAARVDRLRALGNGQVPMAAAVAWQILMEQSS
jgi:DNA (cytosine-5)-methyltransferase 1